MRCHYVPRAHLLRFCNPDEVPLIWAYDKHDGKFFHPSVGNIALETDFYPDHVEHQLATAVEGPANAVINALVAGESISDEQRAALSYYLGVMLKRVPASRIRAAATVPDVLRDTVREFVRHVRRLVDEEELDPVIAEHRIDEAFEVQQRLSRDPPQEMMEQVEKPWPSDQIVDAIASMRWRVITTGGPSFFITTDNPAFFFTSLGLANRESEFCFPMNTRTALVANWQGSHLLQFVPVGQPTVKEVNRRLASQATRFLFYHRPAEWLETIALKTHLYLSVVRWAK